MRNSDKYLSLDAFKEKKKKNPTSQIEAWSLKGLGPKMQQAPVLLMLNSPLVWMSYEVSTQLSVPLL